MTDYTQFRILIDVPSDTPELGFRETSAGLASLISTSEPHFAIAVFGPWGSGKTTLMHAIKRQLAGDSKIISVDFSAWRYEREEHLIIPLLDTIRDALVGWSKEMGRDGGERKAARDTAATIGKVMASILAGVGFKIGLPGALELSFDANKALAAARQRDAMSEKPGRNGRRSFLGDLGRRVRSPGGVEQTFAQRLTDPELPQSFYHACFSALTDAFQHFAKETHGARIVIFVDDLDRCLPAGVIEVLESMKLFFDLNGFIFVVGLDREVVERCVDARYAVREWEAVAGDAGASQRLVRGADYLKKIFQVPFSLAPVSLGMLDELFSSIERGSGLPQKQVDDLRMRVRPHLTYLFSGARLNPREVKRYINAYTIQMKVKPDLREPDVVLALNTLAFRTDCRNLYEAIATFRIEFTSALAAYLHDDPTALDDFDLGTGDIPDDIRTYLSPGEAANALLTADDLDGYLDAGEATRSSFGGFYLDLLRMYRDFRKSVGQAMEAGHPQEFDAAWTQANSLFRSLSSQLMRTEGTSSGSRRMESLERWLDASQDGNEWKRLLDEMNAQTGEVEAAREDAKQEARDNLNRLRLELRQLRRRGGMEEVA